VRPFNSSIIAVIFSDAIVIYLQYLS